MHPTSSSASSVAAAAAAAAVLVAVVVVIAPGVCRYLRATRKPNKFLACRCAIELVPHLAHFFLFVCLSVCQSVCLSVGLSVHLSVCPSFSPSSPLLANCLSMPVHLFLYDPRLAIAMKTFSTALIRHYVYAVVEAS